MDINNFFQSLNEEEKNELFYLSFKWKYPKNNIKYTHIEKFVSDNNIKGRLRSVLLSSVKEYFTYIEEIDINELRKFRNVGEKTINEYRKIRGY